MTFKHPSLAFVLLWLQRTWSATVQDYYGEMVVSVHLSLLFTSRIVIGGSRYSSFNQAVAVAIARLRSVPSLEICRALPEGICIMSCSISALILCSKYFKGNKSVVSFFPNDNPILFPLTALLQLFACTC